jgi:hypothetical protein
VRILLAFFRGHSFVGFFRVHIPLRVAKLSKCPLKVHSERILLNSIFEARHLRFAKLLKHTLNVHKRKNFYLRGQKFTSCRALKTHLKMANLYVYKIPHDNKCDAKREGNYIKTGLFTSR